MLIAVAGPYSHPTAEGRRRNLEALEAAAAAVLGKGHVPVIGVTAALPIVDKAAPEDPYEAIMKISLALVDRCDAILMIGESPGANRERDLVRSKGLPVYHGLDELPEAEG